MMKNLSIPFIAVAVFMLSSCSSQEQTQEQEREALDQKLVEIMAISGSNACIDASNWHYTALGSKACGDPKSYIPYSEKIDVADFLSRVENYNKAEAEFNKKWNVVSNCSIPPEPIDVVCEDNEAKLVY